MPSANKQMEYARLLQDPCNAPLVTGCYPGEVGQIGRFASDFSIGPGQAGFALYYPAINAVSTGFTNTPAVAIPHTWTVAVPFSPGHGILGPGAAKSRCLSSCLQVTFPNVSITNVTGEIVVGCISADSFLQGNYTPDNLFSILTHKALITRNQYEVKFTPGVFDERFTTYGTLTAADQSDTNILVVAWRGLPSTANASIRITSALEYTPKTASGILASGASIAPGVATMSVAASVHKAKPNWWHNLLSDLASDASEVTRYVGRQALSAAGSYAASSLALML